MSFIADLCNRVTPPTARWLTLAREKQLALTKPPGSLGVLELTGNRLASIFKTTDFPPFSKLIYVVAGDHGVTAEGVSAYPSEVTSQMVLNFLSGGAAINVIARHCGIDLLIVDAGVAAELPDHPNLLREKIVYGTANFLKGSALTRQQAEKSVLVGIGLAQRASLKGVNLLGIGDMGIGNTTISSAITAVVTGEPVSNVTGHGSGLDDGRLSHKIKVIERAIYRNNPDPTNALDVLAKVGGVEIGIMTGIVIGAAVEGLAVFSDGFITTAAAALATMLCPAAKEYLFLSHLSPEPGHAALVQFLGLQPTLNLDMRLGEGTGAALAMHQAEVAAKILSEMATFESAGISNKNQSFRQ